MNPVAPMPIARTSAVRLFDRQHPCAEVASNICDRGWRTSGVRVFVWPCGTVAVVTIGSGADEALLALALPHLLATYARAGARNPGPLYVDVMAELRQARAR